ncbi:hypothetical protein [Pedobacter metabolipauper]|nr:hypothetical protein [Pedobacter metabolipauper]
MDIPKQEEGSKMDVSAKTAFDHVEAAKVFYNIARMRLLEVYNWDELCNLPSATFILTDELGNPVKRAVAEGDHFKIDIPGPGTEVGDGYDWVTVEQVYEESSAANQLTLIRVRPSSNPLHKSEETAHFFKDKATSTFTVTRIGNEVYAEVHGRNEIANTDSSGIIDRIRNTIIGLSAKVGLSFPQWQSLVDGLVRNNG